MGAFRIAVQVDAVGNHGCQRDVPDGGIIKAQCSDPACPDCAARRFVQQLKDQGHTLTTATVKHWPGLKAEVTDDLITGIRHGSFY